uniref:Putative ras family small gtpase n=1 Tax=Culex tarsalis TaxID=7177 RepID=A0A1Q3EY65_CULTA
MLTSKISKVGKVVICGAKGVGKTSILEQLIYGNVTLDTEIHSTIEDTYVASVDTGKGSRDTLRIYDTAGLQGSVQLPRHYLSYPDAFILVYDPSDPASLDMLGGIKGDIDKFKDKKEIFIIVIANMRSRQSRSANSSPMSSPQIQQQQQQQTDAIESNLTRANNWCARERIKHYTVNAMERASLYEPFVQLERPSSKVHTLNCLPLLYYLIV